MNRRRLLHHGESFHGDTGEVAATRDDLDDLADYGLVDIDLGGSGRYLVKPTLDGARAARQLVREQRRAAHIEPVDLTWANVRPVLHAIVDAWTGAGGSTAYCVGIEAVPSRVGRPPDDLGLMRTIELPKATDWVDARYKDDTDELIAQPTIRGIRATRGWPGGDSEESAERLLSSLDEIAESSEDEAQSMGGPGARHAYGGRAKTLAEVVSKAIGTAVWSSPVSVDRVI
ncbi:hypothetical protein NBH00_01305 [Paraconexibacter antarcticus]|uniref:Uncharacterized protein n=1 Tax=Paraconexibacter antarcticus TaxID=2949664 RepID=A0ABY5DVZ7_9ACTN|nr:hypothetical protein [Paraconexibacter antarcticus]UTI64857.1 hypothetical protein NBH00_01305 [Paraconexibacter antarcticus]